MWIKPEDIDIQEYHQKVLHLFNWINQVPGFHCGEMTEMEKYRLYVGTFPTHWVKQFNSRGFTEATTYDSINEFMQQQKDEADKTKKKKKKEEESNNRRHPHQRNGGSCNNSKFKINRKATQGPTSKCKKHPNANHAWGDCHLNPNNPNNKLGNQNFDWNQRGNYD